MVRYIKKGYNPWNKGKTLEELYGIEKANEIRKRIIEKGFKVIRFWEHDIKKMELNDFEEIIK